MEEMTGTGNTAVAEMAQIVFGSAGAPGSWKPKGKPSGNQSLRIFNLSMTVDPYVKYLVVKMEEASQVGGAVESIRGSGRDSFLVTMYSKNQ